MRSQGSGHGRYPDNQEQNATGRPRQPTRHTIEVARVRITEAGRRALTGR
jgi:hypothetical protein